MTIEQQLFTLQDVSYADFQAKLTPTVPREDFIGVRVPQLRKLAKELADEAESFTTRLPHRYYEENILHGMFIGQIKDFDLCVEALDTFLPYIDNWAVCDTMSPKALTQNREVLLKKILQWKDSGHTYTCRFALLCLMRYFLDDHFEASYLEIPASIRSEQYYVNMIIAWFYATALAKQWDATVPYLQQHRLPDWIHRKTIQKARESNRISSQQKEYLQSLK